MNNCFVYSKGMLGIVACADALLVIPNIMTTNFGFEAQDAIVKLQVLN